jgi:PucR family transcriptional regulator, purine catabolism regulatory protein
MSAQRPYRVLCVTRPDGVAERALCTLAEDAVAGRGTPPVLGRYDGLLYCLVQPPDGGHAARIAEAVQARGWSGVRVGRSRGKRGADELAPALQEARAAALAAIPNPRPVVDITGLGLAGLLAGLGGDLGAGAFVAHVLGPVIEHDAREGASMLATLRAYLRHGCRPGPAAAQLCIHRHTLAYRLERIAALTGRNLRDGADLLELGLALELHASPDDPAPLRARPPAS